MPTTNLAVAPAFKPRPASITPTSDPFTLTRSRVPGYPDEDRLTNPEAELITMLSYRRPAGDETEELFIERFIDTLPNVEKLGLFENRVIRVPMPDGSASPTLWSSHTDTVHTEGGRQRVILDKETGILSLPNGSASNCLGADCTAGVWIMSCMIRAGVPGLYVFARSEETGGGGSSELAARHIDLFDGIQHAIAFDRYGLDEIITHQWGRCASDKFADDLGARLDALWPVKSNPLFYPSSAGVFTDTANYADLVPECTNVAVGYRGHHSSHETLDVRHASALVRALIIGGASWSSLTVEREPGDISGDTYGGRSYYPSWMDEEPDYLGWSETKNVPASDIDALIANNPGIVADLLESYGMTPQEIASEIYKSGGIVPQGLLR